ncbi:aldolase [Aspergillus steynii IBT 23096]|uniref:Aldolase n=1 Tax=Aspergillus steynii IBT 23096 TaxID=1392250 RepID=A0A2I2G719_9EURO|nr:aldolase [Aspergillus steynii IBT 23096]PLB48655.1 aldolase [Aspergillus steynii IBT 23096]
MTITNPPTWLYKLDEQLNVDVDCMDPAFTLSLFPFVPHDMTSNQILVHDQLCYPRNDDLLRKVVKECKQDGWLAVYTRMSVLMCQANIGNINGRVLLQTLPSYSYDTEKTLEHGRAYIREFERAGISKDRFCLKIPCTGPGLAACAILENEGIRTLGTAVFSVHQAIAASQAGCLYISPYYNELRAHVDPNFWPESEDPALLHPMSSRLIQILKVYHTLYKETGKEQPLVKLASFLSPAEAMAAGELGCQSATISHQVLAQMANYPYERSKQPGQGEPKLQHPYKRASLTPQRLYPIADLDTLASPHWDGKLPSTDLDYLVDGGAKIDKANNADDTTRKRLSEALDSFVAAEKRSQAKIESAMASIQC